MGVDKKQVSNDRTEAAEHSDERGLSNAFADINVKRPGRETLTSEVGFEFQFGRKKDNDNQGEDGDELHNSRW
jgi:hypothetical protein